MSSRCAIASWERFAMLRTAARRLPKPVTVIINPLTGCIDHNLGYMCLQEP